MKRKLTNSIEFRYDDLTWCVKKADLIQPWRSFFLVATWQVWLIATVGVYATAATMFLFFTYYHHRENFHYCTGMALFMIFSIPIPYNPTHGIARIHFGLLLIYGVLAVIAINCYLVSVMTKPQYHYQICTADELMSNDFKILIDTELVSIHELGDDKVIFENRELHLIALS